MYNDMFTKSSMNRYGLKKKKKRVQQSTQMISDSLE